MEEKDRKDILVRLEELTDEELDEALYLSKQLKELTAEMEEVSKCISSKLGLGLINNLFKEDIKKFQDLNENIYKIHEKKLHSRYILPGFFRGATRVA